MIQFDIPLRPEGSCHGVREGFFALSLLFNFTHERHRRGDLWIELRADFEEVAFHLLVTFTHLPVFMRILAISNGEAPTLNGSKTSPGYGKMGRMAGTGQGGRFSLSGRYSGAVQGTSPPRVCIRFSLAIYSLSAVRGQAP